MIRVQRRREYLIVQQVWNTCYLIVVLKVHAASIFVAEMSKVEQESSGVLPRLFWNTTQFLELQTFVTCPALMGVSGVFFNLIIFITTCFKNLICFSLWGMCEGCACLWCLLMTALTSTLHAFVEPAARTVSTFCGWNSILTKYLRTDRWNLLQPVPITQSSCCSETDLQSSSFADSFPSLQGSNNQNYISTRWNVQRSRRLWHELVSPHFRW